MKIIIYLILLCNIMGCSMQKNNCNSMPADLVIIGKLERIDNIDILVGDVVELWSLYIFNTNEGNQIKFISPKEGCIFDDTSLKNQYLLLLNKSNIKTPNQYELIYELYMCFKITNP